MAPKNKTPTSRVRVGTHLTSFFVVRTRSQPSGCILIATTRWPHYPCSLCAWNFISIISYLCNNPARKGGWKESVQCINFYMRDCNISLTHASNSLGSKTPINLCCWILGSAGVFSIFLYTHHRMHRTPPHLQHKWRDCSWCSRDCSSSLFICRIVLTIRKLSYIMSQGLLLCTFHFWLLGLCRESRNHVWVEFIELVLGNTSL